MLQPHQAICVYCASSALIDSIYIDAAHRLGQLIARAGKALVCGAGNTGLMGATINGALNQNGTTIGVIPRFMVEHNWHHPQLTHLEITDDMHSRKQLMAHLSFAAIAMPGGCGTLEELLEIITWRQLGLYKGKIIILNTNGYYDSLLKMLDTAINEKFMRPDHAWLWEVVTTPDEAIALALSTSEVSVFSQKI